MQISEKQRAVVEAALDNMIAWIPREYEYPHNEYLKAISIIRERPANTRKVRSDAGTKRSKGE